MSVYSLDNEVFAAFVKYGSVVVAKLVAMSTITAAYRFTHKTFISEEDAAGLAGNDKDKLKKLMAPNAEVERSRAAHRNDLENIVPFFMIAMLYVAIRPDPSTATMLFKAFAGTRIVHTLVYLGKIRQPARAFAWMVGFGINFYMCVQTIKHMW